MSARISIEYREIKRKGGKTMRVLVVKRRRVRIARKGQA